MPRGTRVAAPPPALTFRLQGSHPLWPAFPCRSARCVHHGVGSADPTAQPPQPRTRNAGRLARMRFRLCPVRSPLLGASRLISCPRGTEMFQFPRSASLPPMCSAAGDGTPSRRVSPFGHPRIAACVRLPEAFRSLPRPSSAQSTEASTIRPCSLGHPPGHRPGSMTARAVLHPPAFANGWPASFPFALSRPLPSALVKVQAVVETGGIEPPTSCLQSRRSIRLSYVPRIHAALDARAPLSNRTAHGGRGERKDRST